MWSGWLTSALSKVMIEAAEPPFAFVKSVDGNDAKDVAGSPLGDS
jgi:hypothetical protein